MEGFKSGVLEKTTTTRVMGVEDKGHGMGLQEGTYNGSQRHKGSSCPQHRVTIEIGLTLIPRTESHR